MNRILLIVAAIVLSVHAYAGLFEGDLVLYPDGCQNTESRKCKLGSILTYKSTTKNLIWQTDRWMDDSKESGTTDGASIPKWAQPIVGDAYDPTFLKAAILHDHYCYTENHVRGWRDTHRMFYDAMIDLGVNKNKAKIMYFAVYSFGPHWTKIVPGENCGKNCIKSLGFSTIAELSESDTYRELTSQAEIEKFRAALAKNPEMAPSDIEDYSKQIKGKNFYFDNGESYKLTGPKDPVLYPVM